MAQGEEAGEQGENSITGVCRLVYRPHAHRNRSRVFMIYQHFLVQSALLFYDQLICCSLQVFERSFR